MGFQQWAAMKSYGVGISYQTDNMQLEQILFVGILEYFFTEVDKERS